MDPAVMSENDDRFKVVFLTDTKNWSSETNDNKPLQLCTASVRLSVLKLLTYFANGTAGQATHLRWGYKLFNSIDDVPPCKRETFKEFTESDVDAFEEQLLQEFEVGIHLKKGSKVLPKLEENKTNAVKTGSMKTGPGISFSNALADAVQDFQWEGPDIRSPVKSAHVDGIARRTRNRAATAASKPKDNNPDSSKTKKSNFVFLFMPVPHHSLNVKDFLGIKKPLSNEHTFTTQELRDHILPVGLEEKLKQHAINLYWIDTAQLHSKDQKLPEGDGLGFKITSETLHQLGGSVIPIRTLLNLENQDLNLFLQSMKSRRLPSFTASPRNNAGEEFPLEGEGGEDGEERSEKRHRGRDLARGFFPWSSVIRHCVIGGQDADQDDGDDYLMLCTKKGSGLAPRCKLKIQPMFGSYGGSSSAEVVQPLVLPAPSTRSTLESPTKRSKRPPTINAQTQDVAFQITKPSPDKVTTPSKSNSDWIMQQNASPSTARYLQSLKSFFDKRTVLIQGVLPTRSLFLGVHYEDKACLCTGVNMKEGCPAPSNQRSHRVKEVEEKVGDFVVNRTLRLSSWFKKMMMDLNQKKLALLVEMHDPTSGLPVSAVIEPLTSVTASLRLVKPNMVRSVEKMMQTYHGIMNPGRGEGDGGRTAGIGEGATVVSDGAMSKITSVAKRCVKEHTGGQRLRRHLSNRVFSPAVTSSLQGRAQKAVSQFHPHQLEAWYHHGSTHGVPKQFVEHLREIPEDLSKQQDQTGTTLDQLLYDLEVMYETKGKDSKPEEKPPPAPAPEVKKVKPKKTLNVHHRVVSIIQLSTVKQATKVKTATPDKNKEDGSKPPVNKAYVEMVKTGTTKHKSEEELVKYLQSSYNRYLLGNVNLDLITFIFISMKPILLFAKSKCAVQVFTYLTEELVEHVRQITAKALLINNAQLRERYKNMDEANSKERRAKEIEMQVYLRLEMEALLPTKIEDDSDKNKKTDGETEASEDENPLDVSMSEEIHLPDHIQETVDEMVTMLQSIPIWVDHSRLTTFLEDVVSNYHKILKPILKVIYNDLMISKPEELLSPSQKAQSSVKKQPKSVQQPLSYDSGMKPASNGGQRSRSLVRHPSFDVGSKRVIPVVIKKEAVKKTKEKKKKKKEPEEDQAKRVCRNLFSGASEAPLRRSPRKKVSLTRRQSIAVMETTNKETAGHRWKSPRRAAPGKSPSRFVLKTRIVKETPGKKQVVQAMLRKQERARQHTTAETVTVGESPDKLVKETPLPKRTTPGKSRSKHVRHHSHKNVFYSQKTGKANAILLGARIAGKTPEPPQPVSRTRHLHVRSQSTSALNRVFSNFASPTTLNQSRKIKLEGEDSPCKNTRSQVDFVPPELPSPKSSKRTPSKSPRRTANRALWKSPSKSTEEPVVQSPSRIDTCEFAVIDTPEKLVAKGTPKLSPVQQSPIKTPKKSPNRVVKNLPKKESPGLSPVKQSPLKTPKKCPKMVVKRTPKRGWSLRTPIKSPSKELIGTSTPVTAKSTTLRISPQKSTNQTFSPVRRRKAAPSHPGAVSASGGRKDIAPPPCERCVDSMAHSHASRGFSSTSFLHPSEISTASSLEDVFESPPPDLKSPARKSSSRKTSGTPELIRMWKQKKNGASPTSSKMLSPKSSVRSESPVFGPEPTPPRKLSTSPLACEKQNIIKQSPAAKRMTSSPTFGKLTPSPGRKRSLRSPASASKQSKSPRGLGRKVTKKQKRSNTAGSSILSFLDIKGINPDKSQAPQNLLDIAEVQHESQHSRKRARNEEDGEELTGVLKKQKNTQDDEGTCLNDVDEFVDVELESNVVDDEVKIISTPKSRINISEVVTEGTSVEELKEFVSPSRKSKSKPLSMGKNRSSDSVPDDTHVETMENTSSTSGDSKPTKHKSFRRLPTRRSLVKRMSSGNSSTSDTMDLVMSPLFSDESMEDDFDVKIPNVSQVSTPLTGSGDSRKIQYTPVSKKGLSDLINSPLINSSEKLKKTVGSREKGSSRRHVSFSSE